MDVLLETVPGGAQNEHVVLESPHEWLPQGATVFLEPDAHGHQNTLLYQDRHYEIRNVRVVDGSEPETTRTALEIGPTPWT